MAATTDWVRGGTATVLLAMALLATGCGSDEPQPSAAPSPSPGREAYLECLRKNGVEPGQIGKAGKGGKDGNGGNAEDGASTAPDESAGGASGEGEDAAGEGGKARAGSPELRKARKACRSLAPRPDPAKVAANKAFRKCMQENGVTLGKGKKDENQGEGEQQEQGEGVRPGDPKFAEALKKCRPLRKGEQPTASASPGS